MKKLLGIGISLMLALLVVRVGHANSTPEVDLQTGIVTNGPIVVNQSFVWVNRVATTCSVTGGTQQWFSSDPVSVPAASDGNTGTATVTATAVGTFTYSSPCLEVGSPRVPVQGSH